VLAIISNNIDVGEKVRAALNKQRMNDFSIMLHSAASKLALRRWIFFDIRLEIGETLPFFSIDPKHAS